MLLLLRKIIIIDKEKMSVDLHVVLKKKKETFPTKT